MLDITRPLLDASKPLRGGRRYKLLFPHELDTLTTFYRALSAEDRRSRFGGSLSDAAIDQYCKAIRWDSTSVIVRSGPCCIEAAATVAQIDKRRVEIALAWPNFIKSEIIVRPLLRLALISARSLYKADEAIIDLDFTDASLLKCARESNRSTISDNLLMVDLQANNWLEAS